METLEGRISEDLNLRHHEESLTQEIQYEQKISTCGWDWCNIHEPPDNVIVISGKATWTCNHLLRNLDPLDKKFHFSDLLCKIRVCLLMSQDYYRDLLGGKSV